MNHNLNLRLLFVAALSSMSVACADKVTNNYHTPPAQAQGGQTYEYASIPAGVLLDGVNDVNFYSTVEGLVIQSEDTSAKNPFGGGFNGGGLGNKAYVGLNQYNGLLMSELESIEFEARLDRGTPFSFINMQVDCDGDGTWTAANDTVVVVDSETAPSASLTFALNNTFKRFVLDSEASIFKSVGGKCGLPSHLLHTGAPLSSLPATAKLFNGAIPDGGMPRNTSMAAILFLMNDSSARDSRQVTLREIKVNDQSYKFYQSH